MANRLDIVAAIHIYDTATGDYLGITLGPPVGVRVDYVDERDPDNHVSGWAAYNAISIGTAPLP